MEDIRLSSKVGLKNDENPCLFKVYPPKVKIWRKEFERCEYVNKLQIERTVL